MDTRREAGFGPPESEPDVAAKAKSKKRRKRDEAEEAKREKDEAVEKDGQEVEEAEANVEVPEPDEQERREITLEAVFRERIALQELAERLPSEAYQQIVEALSKLPGTWSVEKGRHVFTRLISEREIPVGEQTVTVEHRLALNREESPAEPEVIERKIAEAIKPDEPIEQTVSRLESVVSELAPDDEVRVSVSEDTPDIVITPDTARIDEPVQGTEPQPVAPDRVTEIVNEIIHEELEPLPPEPVEPRSLDRVLDILEQNALDLNELPPIAGGAPEAEEGIPEAEDGEPIELSLEKPFEIPEEIISPPVEPLPDTPPEPAPQPRQKRSSRHRRHAPEILNWEPGFPEVVRRPDEQMKRKGRKLIRRLAAEYHLKLTPDIEAYLLAILLRPGVVNGRKVYSLGINVETVVRVMGVLATAGFARPR
ncbi:hypothetical protein EXS54_02585 [Patescibacteria group bacterium]|nr:hypothetical protein [Patescibacteria group bacterium]